MRRIKERFAVIIGTYPNMPKNEFECTAIISLAGIKDRPKLTEKMEAVVKLGSRLHEVAGHWVDHMQKGHPMVLDSFLFTAHVFGLKVSARIGKVIAKGNDEQECVVRLRAHTCGGGNMVFGETLEMNDVYSQDKIDIPLNEYVEADLKNRCKQYNITLTLQMH